MEPRVLLHDDTGAGTPVVLYPGGLTGWVSWVPHQERLADRYRAIRVQPIHNELGAAGVPGEPGYDVVTEREAFRLTLDALGLASTHLAGWSAGGAAALEFAIAYPERVRSLALVEPGALWVLERAGEMADAVEEELAATAALFGRVVTEEELVEFLVTAGLADPAAVRDHPNWDRWVAHRTTLSWLGENLFRSSRRLVDVGRVTCPALLVKGSATTPVQARIVDLLGELMPRARVLELRGGHAAHVERIDEFLAALERQIADAERENAG